MPDIKKIKVGLIDYDICDTYARARIEGTKNIFSISYGAAYSATHTYVDIKTGQTVTLTAAKVMNSCFNYTGQNLEPTTVSALDPTGYIILLGDTGTVNKYYVIGFQEMSIGDTIYVLESLVPDRWLAVLTDTTISLQAIEAKSDFSGFATHGTYSVTHNYKYDKANTPTSQGGAVDVNGSNFTFSGTAATISVSGTSNVSVADHSYTPGGTISVTTTAADTETVNIVTGASLSATPTFAGTAATISVSTKDAVTSIGDHSYTPAGTVSAPTASLTGTEAISANTDAIKAIASTTWTGDSVKLNFGGTEASISGGAANQSCSGSQTISDHSHSIASQTTSVYSITSVGSVAANVVTNWTVSDGVLQLITSSQSAPTRSSTITVVTNVSANTGNAGGHTVNGSNFKYSTAHTHTYTPAGSITSTVVTTGANYTPTMKSVTYTYTAATKATIHGATGVTVGAPTFTGTAATLAHSATKATITLSTSYTPAGTVSTPGITLTSASKTFAINGVKAVSASFAGTTATLKHTVTNGSMTATGSYTPVGTIGGKQAIGSHSHAITYTETALKNATSGNVTI